MGPTKPHALTKSLPRKRSWLNLTSFALRSSVPLATLAASFFRTSRHLLTVKLQRQILDLHLLFLLPSPFLSLWRLPPPSPLDPQSSKPSAPQHASALSPPLWNLRMPSLPLSCHTCVPKHSPASAMRAIKSIPSGTRQSAQPLLPQKTRKSLRAGGMRRKATS